MDAFCQLVVALPRLPAQGWAPHQPRELSWRAQRPLLRRKDPARRSSTWRRSSTFEHRTSLPPLPSGPPRALAEPALLDRRPDSPSEQPGDAPRPSGDDPLISMRGVCKSFGSQRILRGVDLDMRRGERVAIIGPSGTGKSTVLKIIAGLERTDGGDLFVGGERRDPYARRSFERGREQVQISMVFQHAALFDSLTVGENVGFALTQHTRLPREAVARTVARNLAKVGLPGTESKYPSELSGGMRKRVSIARAITADPDDPEDNADVILWDEPTAGLDPIASTRVENLMNDLHADLGNALFVVVTHQDSTLRRTADRIVFLHAGRIQWEGTVAEFDASENGYVKQFREASLDGPMTVAD
eukprot:tig00020964_g16780.t1